MPEFNVVAKVDRVVTTEVKFNIEAENEQEAMDKASKALEEYPEPVFVEGVKRIQTVKSHHWIPRNIEFTKVVLKNNA